MNNRLLPLFLKFLRAGLWGETIDCNVSLERHEWEELYDIAYRQAVTGFFIDGVSRTTMRPDEDIWEKWMVHLLFMERNNRYIAARGEQWVQELKKAGTEAFVFKGTSVAAWYAQPRRDRRHLHQGNNGQPRVDAFHRIVDSHQAQGDWRELPYLREAFEGLFHV